MKLYTKEQVKDMLNGFIGKKYVSDFLHRYYTPIELPSDEEIHNECQIGGMDTNQQLCFQLGAKWMRNKILNK